MIPLYYFSIFFNWIFFAFVVLSAPIPTYPVTIPPANHFINYISNLVSNISETSLKPSIIKEKCPQLWSSNQSEFLHEEISGKLGYITELDEICFSKPNNKSVPCELAKKLSNYLCEVSFSFTRDNLKNRPRPPPLKSDNSSNVCSGFENLTFLNKLCYISQSRGNCIIPDDGRAFCIPNCSGENSRPCKIILQSLMTIVDWNVNSDAKNADSKDASVKKIDSKVAGIGNVQEPKNKDFKKANVTEVVFKGTDSQNVPDIV